MKVILVVSILILLGSSIYAQAGPQWLWAQAAGGDVDDFGGGIALDGAGNSYITGSFAGTALFGTTVLTSLSDAGDIYVAKLDSNGNWLWAQRAGGMGYYYALGIATDASGNCYISGSYYPTATFGATTLTSVGWFDVYTAKLDPDGNWLWAVSAGGPSGQSIPTDLCFDVATDAAGNCYISGSYYDSATFGAFTLDCFGNESSDDLFVAKLDPNGNWLWARSAGGTAEDYAHSIYTDSAGNSYVAGSYCGNAAFGTINLVSTGFYDYEIFAAKLDTNGNWLWASSAGGNNDDWVGAIQGDGSGNCYLTGGFMQNATFGTTSLISDDFSWDDIFIAKLDSGGNWLWAKQAGGLSEDDDGYGIAVDNAGNCYVTGSFGLAAEFGIIPLNASGISDIFVAKLNSSGDWLWAVQAGGPNDEDYYDTGTGIATNASGFSWVTGCFNGPASFAAISLTGFGSYDAFVAKLSPGGTGIDDPVQIPASAFQMKIYPNPFNPETTISYTLPTAGSVSLEIINSRGQLVKSLLKEEQPTGEHTLVWNGKDDSGHSVASGLYLCRIACNGAHETRKLLLLK